MPAGVGSTQFIAKSDVDTLFSPDIWSKNVLVKQEANLVLANLVNREYEREARVGKQVFIPTISDLGVRDKTVNTIIQYEVVAETKVTLVLNKWKYAAIGIEDIVEVQSQVNLRSEYEHKIAYALAKEIDSELAAAVILFTHTYGTLGTPFSDQDLRNGIQFLDDANVPGDGRVLVMSPAEKNDKLGLEKWTNTLYRGDNTGNGGGSQVNNGRIGNEIYDVTPYVSSNLYKTGTAPNLTCANVLMHKDAYGLVIQRQPQMHLFYDIDFFTWKVASEMILGHGELRDDFCVYLQGKG